ncbi:MAG TPA: ATP-binding protein [Roseiflexaceae bacterium]|nr:ATP-binding protein [Roseiflexaceae bacterium]
MPDQPPVAVDEFLASFKRFMDQVERQAPPQEEPVFLRRLREHFGQEPTALPILSEQFRRADHPNLHLALTAYVGAEGCAHELYGLTVPNDHAGIRLVQLTQPDPNEWARPREAPVEYVNVPLHDDQVLACVQTGLYLIRGGAGPLAVLVRGPTSDGWRRALELDVMAAERSVADAFLAEIRRTMRARNVYRGHVISLEPGHGDVAVKFHRLPPIAREQIVLPDGVLERIERQTIGFARLGERLRAGGRHLKRGLLLYGPPGTGKTLTAMYLASQMPDRTIIVLTGSGIGFVEHSCALARLLQPATVILEDVDLIAEERTHQSTGTNALLFELLNQMDGLADDCDVLFLLTTNRPEILEPALAARPGRVDQAMLVPLPDRACRERLIALYSRGLTVRLADTGRLLDQTEGVSAAFIRELLRKAALFAADEGPDLVVEERHLNEALHELVVEGGELTRRLLGASTQAHTERPRGEC